MQWAARQQVSAQNAARRCSAFTSPFQEPSTLDSAGRPVLKFGKLLHGRAARQVVLVRNNGALTASTRLEMERHDAFAVLEGPQQVRAVHHTMCLLPTLRALQLCV